MSDNALLKLTQIIQTSSLAESSREQVQIIVDAISKGFTVEVCSLFRLNNNKDMVLIATHGLSIHHPIVVPKTQGLVGRVAKLRRSINIINPAEHPDYYFIPQSREEHFHSFCGVPLVHQGEVIGVLVVQSRRSELLAAEQEAMLATLAAHLAVIINSLPQDNINQDIQNERKTGISGSSGIAIGRVKNLKNNGLKFVIESDCEDKQLELLLWNDLKEKVTNELQNEKNIIEKNLGENLAGILDAYQLFLEDRSFSERINNEINGGKSLPWAIKKTVQFYSEQFLAMDDPYLRAKHEDIQQLGEKLYQNWQGDTQEKSTADNQTPLILIGPQVSVSDIANLPTKILAGIVCFEGAALSHIAVFANALGIPAVMGTGDLTIQDGEQIIIDGDNAKIFLNPNNTLLEGYYSIIKNRESFDRNLSSLQDQPAITKDGISIELMANSGLQADIMPGIHHGADGVGLYRTEIPFMVRQNLPTEEEQIEVYKRLIDAYQDKPVYIRTLDIGADKPLPYLPLLKEENPALGLRGIRFTLDNLQLLMTQYRAIMRAAENNNSVHITLPMIGSSHELDQSIQLLNEAHTQLLDEGYSLSRPKMGIMVEIPSAITLLPFWSQKLDFVSIGSNDLSQYILAIDRNNPKVGKYYDSLHPAVINEIQRIIKICQQSNLPVSLCGEMASDPVAVLVLLGMGIRKLSISSSKIPLIKWLIRSINIIETENLLHEVLKLDNASAIRDLCQQTMKNIDR